MTHSSTTIPYRVDDVVPITALTTFTTEPVRVAGRIIARRLHSRVAFLDIRDASGTIQILVTSDCDETLRDQPVGTWVTVAGVMGTSRAGESSLIASSWQLLARCESGLPDERYGLTDPDDRYRRRWVDLASNPVSHERFRARSRIISGIRRRLEDDGYLEVETPMLSDIASGAAARPFTTHHNTLDRELYLRIAPELYLKRLVIGGFERVFEIGRAFRNEGISPRHNPEFTILEVYCAYADLTDMQRLTESLIRDLATEVTGTLQLDVDGHPIDLEAPWQVESMSSLVSGACDTALTVDSPACQLRSVAATHGVEVVETWTSGRIIAELFGELVEPTLWQPIFVTDYPREISPLARAHRNHPGLTERFELFIAGREIANAFTELCDPAEQAHRFIEQARMAGDGDDEAMSIDLDYVDALRFGLPPTGGLGIGVDRLVMLLTGATTIRDVILFPTLRERGSSPPPTA